VMSRWVDLPQAFHPLSNMKFIADERVGLLYCAGTMMTNIER
jgi:hypothetical protein